jgi:hypothetical protein
MKLMLTASSVALALGLCAAGPLAAATDLSFSGLSGAEYDTAGVYVLGDVNFTATTDDGGGYDSVLFQLWDDGVVKFEDTYSLLVGTSGSFHFETYYPGLVGTAAQGVGLYLSDVPNGTFDFYIDPYDVPHYADPGQCQVDCGPAAVPLPASLPLLAAGIGGIFAFGRRRKQS